MQLIATKNISMIINYKKTIAVAVTAITLLAFKAPETYAANESDINFCAQFAVQSAKLETGIAERDTVLQKSRVEQDGAVAKKRADQDTKLADARANADANRTKQYDKLLTSAITDTQKQAVATFKSKIETSVSIRKAKVDSAIKASRTNIDTVVSTHKIAVDKALQTFKAKLNDALAKTTNSCATGKNPKTIRAEYTKTLTVAKNKLKSDRNAIPKTVPQISKIAQLRKTAIEKAFNTFHTELSESAKNLKMSFKK